MPAQVKISPEASFSTFWVCFCCAGWGGQQLEPQFPHPTAHRRELGTSGTAVVRTWLGILFKEPTRTHYFKIRDSWTKLTGRLGALATRTRVHEKKWAFLS